MWQRSLRHHWQLIVIDWRVNYPTHSSSHVVVYNVLLGMGKSKHFALQSPMFTASIPGWKGVWHSSCSYGTIKFARATSMKRIDMFILFLVRWPATVTFPSHTFTLEITSSVSISWIGCVPPSPCTHRSIVNVPVSLNWCLLANHKSGEKYHPRKFSWSAVIIHPHLSAIGSVISIKKYLVSLLISLSNHVRIMICEQLTETKFSYHPFFSYYDLGNGGEYFEGDWWWWW